MGEMASALAHELNQPLTAIINYAQATRRVVDVVDEERRAALVNLLEKTSQQASRAGQIIHRLRQFIAKGETERTLEDVNAVVEEASALALIGTAGRGIGAAGVQPGSAAGAGRQDPDPSGDHQPDSQQHRCARGCSRA
jgi:two-component system sensor kinase FixL